MKKLIILISLIALVASGMAFAQVTISGQIEYEVAESFDKDQDSGALTKKDPDTRAILNIKADDFTSGWIRLRVRKEDAVVTDVTTTPPPTIIKSTLKYVDYDRAYFTTNFLPAFGVKDAPVDVMGTFGLNEFGLAYAGNVEWDIIKGAKVPSKNFTKWGMMPKVSIMKMVDVATAFDLEAETLKNFFTDAVITVPAGPGALKVEGTYGVLGTKKFDEGYFLAQLAYAMKMGDIGINVGGGYNVEMKKTADSGYGFGVKASLGTLAYGFVGLQGLIKGSDSLSETQPLHNVRIGASVTPVPLFGLDVGVILYTGGKEKISGDDREVFNTLDASAIVKAGKANFRLGYIYTPEGDKSIDPWKTDAEKKSLYFIATLAY